MKREEHVGKEVVLFLNVEVVNSRFCYYTIYLLHFSAYFVKSCTFECAF